MYPLLINLILRSLPRSQPTPCHRSTLPLLCVTRVFHFLYLYYKDSLFNVPTDNDKFSAVYVPLSFFTYLFIFFFIKEDASFRRMKSVEFIYMYIYITFLNRHSELNVVEQRRDSYVTQFIPIFFIKCIFSCFLSNTFRNLFLNKKFWISLKLNSFLSLDHEILSSH